MNKSIYLILTLLFVLQIIYAQHKSIEFDASDLSNRISLKIGTNAGPEATGGVQADFTDFYKEIGILSIRAHDFYGPCDWWTIFPNWKADPNDPKSYDFKESDAKILKIKNSGFEVLFRLGTSWKGKNPLPINDPPGTIRDGSGKIIHNADTNDFKKFAEICKHIIMHYNYGWNNGYNLNIQKWEIWNEPTLKEQFWSGTPIQFFQMYSIVAKYLKESFPEIEIGGPAQEGMVDLKYERDFINYCKTTKTPLDFYSYHSYGGEKSIASPFNIPQRATQIREALVANNYKDTKVICDEWNALVNELNFSHTGKGAAFYASTLAYSVYYNIPEIYQYRADNHPLGLIDQNLSPKLASESFKTWKLLNQNQVLLKSTNSYDTLGFTSIATINEKKNSIRIIVSNYQNIKQSINIAIKKLNETNSKWILSRRLIDNTSRLKFIDSTVVTQASDALNFPLIIDGESVQYLELSLISIPKPSKVTLIEPKNDTTIIQDTIYFKWQSSEPSVLTYQIQIFYNDNLILSDSTLSDTIYKYTHEKKEGQYKWQIRAKNSTGWGDWSDLWNFQVKINSSNIRTDSDRSFSLNISPNPAQDYIDINIEPIISSANHSIINIYNVYGESVIALVPQNQSNKNRIDISQLPVGIYFLQVGLKQTKLVIIR